MPVLQKFSSHLKILGARKVTWSSTLGIHKYVLGMTAQNLVIWEIWHLELVHTWHTVWALKPADVVAAHLLSHNGLQMKSGITLNYLHRVLGQPARDWSSQKGKNIPTVISSVEQHRGNVPVSQTESVNTGQKQFLFSTSQSPLCLRASDITQFPAWPSQQLQLAPN
jgi:hypothetical protein